MQGIALFLRYLHHMRGNRLEVRVLLGRIRGVTD
jgi:hypothetical protein